MAILGREALDPRAVETLEVEVPGWGGSILIRKLSAAEVSRLSAMASSAVDGQTKAIKDPDQMVRFMATSVFLSWVTSEGDQVLTNRAADVERLSKEPFDLMDSLSDTINAFNGIGNKAAVEEAKKNSAAMTSDDSGSF